MTSRRNFLSLLLATCFVLISWLNFAPAANAMGGKLPAINQPAPEFTSSREKAPTVTVLRSVAR